ncbi:MAG TPA: phosphotransferase [Pirellulales bacterium]|nr:phosphotransferase [Pirellulales bacterium]
MSRDRLPIRELTPLVERALRAAAGEFGIQPDALVAEYVLNWGGFGTPSFSVQDGQRRLHVKLTDDPRQKSELRRWQSIHDLLEQEYHAPPMVGWLTIDGTAYEGPVFAFIDGVFLDGFRMPNVVAEVLDCVERLHADTGLAFRLTPHATVNSHLDCLLARTQMLREDLEIIRAERPPFVPSSRLAWMADRLERLDQAARDSGAFGGLAQSAIHWDLWWNNFLVRPNGQWYILDWDSLGLGDPALDVSTVLFPLSCGNASHGDAARPWPDSWLRHPKDEAFSVRMRIYRQAQVLEYVIDVLADWVEARKVPELQAEVRARKQQEHEQFLAIYHRDYGE